jgi:hypothetical protein
MSIPTMLQFLAGRRRAILEVAGRRGWLAVGFLFVMAAAFAREYDGADLLAEPWHLILPLVASVALSFVLFLPVYWRLAPRVGSEDTSERPPFREAYLSFLAVFWMTAPLALLYAIPYERFLSEAGATTANLWTLAVVALWRVLLISRAVGVLTNRSPVAAFFLVALVADVAVLAALYLSPIPVIDLMGGVRQTARESILQTTALFAGFVAVVTMPVWAIGAMVVLARSARPTAGWVVEPPGERVGRGAVVLALLSLAVWPFVLPHTQAEQRLRRRVEQEVRAGRVRAALETMSAHSQEDFPPHWDPPPRPAYREDGPPLLDVMEALAARLEAGMPTPTWVRRVYAEKFERAYLSGTYLRYHASGDPQAWQRIDRLLARLPEGPDLAQRYGEQIDSVRRDFQPATSPRRTTTRSANLPPATSSSPPGSQ